MFNEALTDFDDVIFMTSKRSTSCSLNSTTSDRLKFALNCFES